MRGYCPHWVRVLERGRKINFSHEMVLVGAHVSDVFVCAGRTLPAAINHNRLLYRRTIEIV
jgi:hypothetical protein